MSLEQRWLKAAYQGSRWLTPLYPLGDLYRYLVARRSSHYHAGKKLAVKASVPVIVVGNITLGGTGKSPLVAWLVNWLRKQGWSPGIITRGYGGKASHYPLRVTAITDPAQSGDEPLMLAQQTGCRSWLIRAVHEAFKPWLIVGATLLSVMMGYSIWR